MGSEKDFSPEQSWGHRFRMVSVAIDKYMHCKELAADALPRGQGPMCGYLMRNQDHPVFQKELEQAFHLSGATVSNCLQTMERSGLITREPMPEDGRLKQIRLTGKGMELEIKDVGNILRMEEAMKRGFSEEEMARFEDYLERAVANLREME